MRIHIDIENTRLSVQDSVPRTSCHGAKGVKAFSTSAAESGRESITVWVVGEDGKTMAELVVYSESAAQMVIAAIETALEERAKREARTDMRVAA